MTQKLWGKTQLVHQSAMVEIHRIEVVRGGYCSIHQHRQKANKFFVESGKLRVTRFPSSGHLCRDEILHTGDSLTVAAGELHQFEAVEPTVAFEIYWADRSIDPGDIVRYSQGGTKERINE